MGDILIARFVSVNSASPRLKALPEIQLAAMEVLRVNLEMKQPFRTAHGVEYSRTALLVRALGHDGEEGWGECSALSVPTYTGEWVNGAEVVLRDFLIPAALEARPSGIVGHPMSSIAVEMALTQLALTKAGLTLAQWLGAVREQVPCGVAVGMSPSIDELVSEVGDFVIAGYHRVKLKICPGYDVEPVRAIRSTWPNLALGVDANGSYHLDDLDGPLADLDELGLVEIEQPFVADNLLASAKAVDRFNTPICLDESIGSRDDLSTAIQLGACDHVNLKPARVGGIGEAMAIYELAIENDIPIWIGGMLETGVGKEVTVAFSALPGVTMAGDLPASSRWFLQDITDPWEINGNGMMSVRPAGPLRLQDRPDC